MQASSLQTMATMDETADILGQPTLPRMEGFPDRPSSYSWWKLSFFLIVFLFLLRTALRIRRHVRKWQQDAVKLCVSPSFVPPLAC